MERHGWSRRGYLSWVGGGLPATGDRSEGRVQQRGSALPGSPRPQVPAARARTQLVVPAGRPLSFGGPAQAVTSSAGEPWKDHFRWW